MAAILATAWVLFLLPIAAHPLREDEALYASWALAMRHGNPWLVGLPIDKPPLYLWLLAAWQSGLGETVPAMRLLNSSLIVLNVVLVYALGRQLVSPRVGGLAAAVFAASPFTILFAPTLYTDPLLTLWLLAACLAAARARWSWLGLCLGLALITKQHGLLLAPLPLALAAPRFLALTRRARVRAGIHVAWSLLLPLAAVFAWDSIRMGQAAGGGPPNVWQQSAISYGGLALAAPATWPARAIAWLDQGQYITGFLPATLALAAAALALWVRSTHAVPRRGQTQDDHGRDVRVIALFGLLYLALHIVLTFQVWDRYLLPLVPLAALVAGWGWAQLTRRVGVVAWLLIVCCLLPPALVAAHGGYPVGSDHGTYDGIEATAAEVRQVLPDNKWGVLYHQSLGWHWRYYLAGTRFQHVYYATPTALAADAAGPAGYVRVLAVPAWEDITPVQQALAQVGQLLRQRFTAYRDDGSPAFYVFAVEPATPAWPAPLTASPHGPQEVP